MAVTPVYVPATFIGPAADKAAYLGGAAVGDYYFEDDTGLTYRKSTTSTWTQVSSTSLTSEQSRNQFLSDILAVTGDTRLLYTPKSTDTTTSLDESLNARVITHDATIAARLNALGLGYYTTFNGNNQFATAPDAANLSFIGVGAAFSAFVLANVTDSAGVRFLLGKFNEYAFSISGADKLQVQLVDTGGVAVPSRLQDTALTTQGAWALYGFTYTRTSAGASAANDITIYVNGLAVPSTATNDAAYTDMGDKATALSLWTSNAGAGSHMLGSGALIGLVSGTMTASQHWAVKKIANSYFRLSL